MIGQIVDQIQKLFGRAFLIAYFIPSLFFVVTVCYLWWGADLLLATINQWSQQGWKQAITQLVLSFIAVYLLAYGLYGVRYFLQQIYEGEWRIWPLRWLRRRALKLQEASLKKYEAIAEEHLEALNNIYWASKWNFEDSPTLVELNPDQARDHLQQASRLKLEICERLEKRKELKKREFAKLLRLSRELHANREQLDAQLKEEIEGLIRQIQQAYDRWDDLKDAADILEVRGLREWDTAKDYFSNNFPENERLLRPTRLGNIIVVHELYPLSRYGISLSALWPRLYHVIPENARLRIEDASIYADFTIIMSFLSVLTTVISVFCISTHQFRQLSTYINVSVPYLPPVQYSLRMLFPIIFLALAWAFYRASIYAALAMGVQIQAAVDLFRLKLLDALDIERPDNPEKEIEVWEALFKFFASAEIPKEKVKFRPVKVVSEMATTSTKDTGVKSP